jgi:hypothetical protein
LEVFPWPRAKDAMRGHRRCVRCGRKAGLYARRCRVTHTSRCRCPIGIRSRSSPRRTRTGWPTWSPVRVGRMLQSPFAYYRGTAAVMAHDLTAAPVTGQRLVCCGDAHISNFGLFASPERRLLFDLNDFRRDVDRAMGVGRQAARGQCGHRRTRHRIERLRVPRIRSGRRVGLPHGDARAVRDKRPGHVLLPSRDRQTPGNGRA